MNEELTFHPVKERTPPPLEMCWWEDEPKDMLPQLLDDYIRKHEARRQEIAEEEGI